MTGYGTMLLGPVATAAIQKDIAHARSEADHKADLS
jgi:hypothetical protein